MRTCRSVVARCTLAGLFGLAAYSQTPPPQRGPATAATSRAQGAQPQVMANLLQLMRGTLFIFAAQSQDPAAVPPAKDPSTATDPLANTYGQWLAVENSALAIAEVANLLNLPGRKCANGIDVPIRNADWAKFVQGLRDAGMTAYKAAQSKNQDTVTDAAGTLSESCANSHDKYREKSNLADRCK